MTSLQLSNFIKLDALDRVVGITSTRHLFNKEMNDRLEAGQTVKIGIEGNFNNEAVMSMNPDLILISPYKRGGYDALKEVGIPLIPHLGYKETTPLGQAEWIKFVGILCGMEQEANARFSSIEKRYNELKALTGEGEVSHRPIVFSGECFSIIFKDAELKEITACLNDASEGKQYISERAKAYLQNKNEDRKDNVQPLTATEKEILRALALGKSTKDIASERFISIHTAITHRKNIFRKLNVNNLNEAVRYAIRAGIVDITEYYI